MKQHIERHQVWIYLLCIAAGLMLGMALPDAAPLAEAVLWPVLGVLLYVTFTQVPLTHLPEAFRDARFIGAGLLGNFVLIPAIVSGLLFFLPDDPAVRLGVLLVLLVPCTDWFVTFTHLGGGDARRAIAVTPVNLLVQIALLPVYLWIFMGENFAEILAADRIAAVFVTLILLPLAAAFLTERWAERKPARAGTIERLGLLPVPLLGLVVFLIATAQVQAVADALPVLGHVAGIFVAFLVLALLLGLVLGRVFGLPATSARTLVFSFGTRNSFVVLPLSLALAAPWQAATVVIVFQGLVELFGMVAYLWLLPRIVLDRTS